MPEKTRRVLVLHKVRGYNLQPMNVANYVREHKDDIMSHYQWLATCVFFASVALSCGVAPCIKPHCGQRIRHVGRRRFNR